MIKILRTPAPTCLDLVPDASTKVYARTEVRQSLIDMQYGKCCYCERKVDLQGIFADDGLSAPSNVEKHVEHFRPKGKALYRDRTNDWSNLLLACNTCNTNKGQRFDLDQDGNPLCIDPSDPDDNPEDHLELSKLDLSSEPHPDDGKILSKNGSVKGDWTVRYVRLNESACRKDRWTKIKELVRYVVDYRMASPNSEERKTALQFLVATRLSCKEFAFVAREVCRQYGIPDVLPT